MRTNQDRSVQRRGIEAGRFARQPLEGTGTKTMIVVTGASGPFGRPATTLREAVTAALRH